MGTEKHLSVLQSWKKFIASVDKVNTIATEINIAANAAMVIKTLTIFSNGLVEVFDNWVSKSIKILSLELLVF